MPPRPSTNKPVGMTRSELFSKRAAIACESDLSQALTNCFSKFWRSDSSDSAAASEPKRNPTSAKVNDSKTMRFTAISLPPLDVFRSDGEKEESVTATPPARYCSFATGMPGHFVGATERQDEMSRIRCELPQSETERVRGVGATLAPNALT